MDTRKLKLHFRFSSFHLPILGTTISTKQKTSGKVTSTDYTTVTWIAVLNVRCHPIRNFRTVIRYTIIIITIGRLHQHNHYWYHHHRRYVQYHLNHLHNRNKPHSEYQVNQRQWPADFETRGWIFSARLFKTIKYNCVQIDGLELNTDPF